jgi:hypothetical protein
MLVTAQFQHIQMFQSLIPHFQVIILREAKGAGDAKEERSV